MKIVILFFLLLSTSFSYTLGKSYSYSQAIIYASDIFPEITEDFEVVTMPSHLQHFQLSQRRLYELFERHGITLEGEIVGVVKFKRESNLKLSELKLAIRNYYLKHLPYLTIKDITVEASRHIEKLPQTYEIHFKKTQFKQNRGSFKITTAQSRIFFKFTLKATYSQFQAASTLKKGTIITADNTKMVIVDFTRAQGALIGYDALSHIQSKRYLKKGKAITQKDVMPIYFITKGSIVNVKLIEGNILIHFTAKALKSGNLHEKISVKKSDGTKLRVEITGKNEVSVE